MRFILAFVLACGVSALLFLMMYRLVNYDDSYPAKQQPVMVDISRMKTPERKKQPEQQAQKKEPRLQPLQADTVEQPIKANIEIELPAMDIQVEDNTMYVEQKYWSQPVGAQSGMGADYIGESENTNIVITPVATRRPNIPKVAYDNRVNGWVLLAYTVTPKGYVKNIRVMDAYPRGIFEANAIAAVSTWRYSPFKGKAQYISQRIEFEWNMYSYNMDIK